jgi:hypothetical protein
VRTRGLIAAFLLAAGAAGARADAPLPGVPPERRRLVSVGAGLVEPVSRISFGSAGGGSADNGDLGVQFGVQYVQFLTKRLGAGLSVDYFNRGATFSTRLYPSADAAVAGDTWLLLGLLRFTLLDRGPARPFVLVGAGGAWNKMTVDVRPSSWPDTATHETRRLLDDSAWTPAAAVRAGLDLVSDAAAPGVVTVEAGWTGLGSARYAPTPRGEARGVGAVSAPLHVLTFAARYGWRF